MLAAGLIVGVVVSILQTVTSIQDNILSFIPRAAAIFVVFAFTFPVDAARRHRLCRRARSSRLPELVR